MAYVPIEQSAFEPGPREYLSRLIQLLSSLHSAHRRHLPLLMEKVHEVMPSMTLPMLRSLPSGPPQSRMDEIYGSAGSTPVSHSGSSYTSPPSQGSGLQAYAEVASVLSSHLAGHSSSISGGSPMTGPVYASFTSSTEFPHLGTTSAPAQLGQGGYQTHLPARTMYPS